MSDEEHTLSDIELFSNSDKGHSRSTNADSSLG